MKCHSYHVGYILSTRLVVDGVNFVHLAKAVFARLLHWEVTFVPLYTVLSGSKSLSVVHTYGVGSYALPP